MSKPIDKSQQLKKFLENYANTLDMKQSAINAGYRKQTAAANALNILSSAKWRKELDDLCEKRAAYLDISKAYIVKKYLKLLSWAFCENDDGKPTDPTLALRALDGLIKQLSCPEECKKEENASILTSIKNLNTEKI